MFKFLRMDDSNPTSQELEIYNLVLEVTGRYNLDPSSSIAAENFFDNLLASYHGTLENLSTWLDQQIQTNFKVIEQWPKWIQNSDWPFVNGKSAIFVGQIDTVVTKSALVSQLFHDDVSYYVFIGENVAPIVIMQQF